MRRCIVHFGLHKTGSSSIQRFLRRQLSDPDFVYPESGFEPTLRDDCHNRALVAAFSTSPERYHTHAIEGVSLDTLRARGEQFKTRLRTWSEEEGSQTLILSAEELSDFEVGEVRAMADFLRSLPCEVSGLAYVRKYKRLQESRFQQALRIPSRKRRLLPPEHDRFACFPYRHKIEKFQKLLGYEAVTIRKYERRNLAGACVVRDFCANVGINQNMAGAAVENQSLSLDAVRLLYAHRKFAPSAPAGKDPISCDHLLATKLAGMGGVRAAFHSALLTRSEHCWRRDVDWMSNFFGEDMLGDLVADDDGPCIRSEADLFCFSHESIEWLAHETGLSARKLHRATNEEVAEAVGILREKTLGSTTRRQDVMVRAKHVLKRIFSHRLGAEHLKVSL